jgi:D-alanyl-D-alanine carboxypeptidase (penicillin-binding protein 5/6)
VFSAFLLTLALGAPGLHPGLRPVPLPPPPLLAFPAPEAPQISARSWMVYSVDHDAELGSKDPDLLMPPASITKLMTAVLAEQALDLSTTITISAVADATPIGFTGQPDVRQGEVWLARDLLANVMVQSGNDASTAVAEAVSGTVAVRRVDEHAAELGMDYTTFRNPHGLDDAEHHDCSRPHHHGQVRLDFPVTLHLPAPSTSYHIDGRIVDSRHRLARGFRALGLKTGDTANAGRCCFSLR